MTEREIRKKTKLGAKEFVFNLDYSAGFYQGLLDDFKCYKKYSRKKLLEGCEFVVKKTFSKIGKNEEDFETYKPLIEGVYEKMLDNENLIKNVKDLNVNENELANYFSFVALSHRGDVCLTVGEKTTLVKYDKLVQQINCENGR